jgi:beta-lactamase regulating signal transducer with metallopeptidase domain
LFFAEILIVLAWWNPFSWLIRKSIRQNLEFIADREVIKQGADIKPYQMLLLKTMQVPALSITNAFSVSHLKKRIKMMNVKP